MSADQIIRVNYADSVTRKIKIESQSVKIKTFNLVVKDRAYEDKPPSVQQTNNVLVTRLSDIRASSNDRSEDTS